MIQSNNRLYQEINEIIAVLKQSGEVKYASKLENALSISTIPSEILGELRIALLDLKKSNLSEELKIKGAINESLNYIDAIL